MDGARALPPRKLWGDPRWRSPLHLPRSRLGPARKSRPPPRSLLQYTERGTQRGAERDTERARRPPARAGLVAESPGSRGARLSRNSGPAEPRTKTLQQRPAPAQPPKGRPGGGGRGPYLLAPPPAAARSPAPGPLGAPPPPPRAPRPGPPLAAALPHSSAASRRGPARDAAAGAVPADRAAQLGHQAGGPARNPWGGGRRGLHVRAPRKGRGTRAAGPATLHPGPLVGRGTRTLAQLARLEGLGTP